MQKETLIDKNVAKERLIFDKVKKKSKPSLIVSSRNDEKKLTSHGLQSNKYGVL